MHRLRWGAVVLVLAIAVAGAGWAVLDSLRLDDAPPLPCDRGFRADDWRREPVRAGRAVAECGWANRWTAAEAERRLGAPLSGYRRGWMVYVLGPCDCGLGPHSWVLTLQLDRSGRRVVRATAEPEPV